MRARRSAIIAVSSKHRGWVCPLPAAAISGRYRPLVRTAQAIPAIRNCIARRAAKPKPPDKTAARSVKNPMHSARHHHIKLPTGIAPNFMAGASTNSMVMPDFRKFLGYLSEHL